jgi:hypothetical protein
VAGALSDCCLCVNVKKVSRLYHIPTTGNANARRLPVLIFTQMYP